MEERLNFESLIEFQKYLELNQEKNNTRIVQAIEDALENKSEIATIFEVEIESLEYLIEISLERGKWEEALETVLKQYTEKEDTDKAIDTWLLLKKVKE